MEPQTRAECYNGAIQFKNTSVNGSEGVSVGPYRASTRCTGINVKIVDQDQNITRVQVQFADRQHCRPLEGNYGEVVRFTETGVWKGVADNVRDNTCFYLWLKGDSFTIPPHYTVIGEVAS